MKGEEEMERNQIVRSC